MKRRYWELFWETGTPVFYLLYRLEAVAATGINKKTNKEINMETKTAWKDTILAAEV